MSEATCGRVVQVPGKWLKGEAPRRAWCQRFVCEFSGAGLMRTGARG